MQATEHACQQYQLAHVHRVTKRISQLSQPDSADRIYTLKSKYTGCYGPVCFVMVVPVGFRIGDAIPGIEHLGTIPGTTY